MPKRWWAGDPRLSRGERARAVMSTAVLTAFLFWCGVILDRPGIAWWKHGIVAVPLGIVTAAITHVRSSDYTRASNGHPITRRRTLWLVVALWVAVVVGYAIYRNGPAQYVVAAILSVGAIVVALRQARDLVTIEARDASRRETVAALHTNDG